MKKNCLSFIFICSSLFAFSQELVVPPELNWWINETQKGNSGIVIEDFKYVSSRKLEYINGEMNQGYLYPVFARWNYSGNRIGYFNIGASLTQTKSRKYHIDFDIDSNIVIIEKNKKKYVLDTFGSMKGIDGIAWLKDDVLIGVGQIINYIDESRSSIDLIIDQYIFTGNEVIVKEYILRNVFDNDIRLKLKLNWYQQRPDYFE